MISYVIEHKESVNEELKEWIQTNGYRLINVNDVPGIQRKEVLIVNYDKNGNTSIFNKQQVLTVRKNGATIQQLVVN